MPQEVSRTRKASCHYSLHSVWLLLPTFCPGGGLLSFDVKYNNLEIRVRSHTRSSKVTSFENISVQCVVCCMAPFMSILRHLTNCRFIIILLMPIPRGVWTIWAYFSPNLKREANACRGPINFCPSKDCCLLLHCCDCYFFLLSWRTPDRQ